MILLVDVYHEFAQPYEMTEKMVNALKPGGRIVFVEFRLEDEKVPIKLVHKMTEKQVIKEMAEFKEMKHTSTSDKLPWQHVITFTKEVPKSRVHRSFDALSNAIIRSRGMIAVLYVALPFSSPQSRDFRVRRRRQTTHTLDQRRATSSSVTLGRSFKFAFPSSTDVRSFADRLVDAEQNAPCHAMSTWRRPRSDSVS
jgi:hypothetical protein